MVVEDDSELLLERIEEEMAAEELDSEDDEDIFLHVDDLHKVSYCIRAHGVEDEHNCTVFFVLQLNMHSQKVDDVLQTNITNEEWQLEVERILPSLKLTIKTGTRDLLSPCTVYSTTIRNSRTPFHTCILFLRYLKFTDILIT